MILVLAIVLPFDRLHSSVKHCCSSSEPASCDDFCVRFRKFLEVARLGACGINEKHVAVYVPDHAIRPQYEGSEAICGFSEPSDEHFDVLNARAGALIDVGLPGTFADDDPRRAPVLLVMC